MRWKKSARSIAGLTILLTLTGCASVFGIGKKTPETNSLCSRYPDAAHPPIEFFDGDGAVEAGQKARLLTVWLVECGIE